MRGEHSVSGAYDGAAAAARRGPLGELLYFEGCPSWRTTLDLIVESGRDIDVQPRIFLVAMADEVEARRRKFLGSPSVRVDGVDVEPGADERSEFALACRIYRGEAGASKQPESCWVRESLEHAASYRASASPLNWFTT